jgi:hypothetical protein
MKMYIMLFSGETHLNVEVKWNTPDFLPYQVESRNGQFYFLGHL